MHAHTDAHAPISVVLLDDHAMVREAVVDYLGLQPGFTVVGATGDVDEALRLVEEHRPTIALLEAELPGASGLEVCREVGWRWPEVACVILTARSDEEAYLGARLSGAAGFLVKTLVEGALVDGLRSVAAGERLPAVDPVALEPRVAAQVDRRSTAFSAQERQVLSEVVHGASDPEIAETLHQSPRQVSAHLSSIFRGLGLAGVA